MKKASNSVSYISEAVCKNIHICMLYQNEQERKEVLLHFFKTAIENNDQVTYVGQKITHTTLKSALAENGINIQSEKQLQCFPAQSTYCPDGIFDPERSIQQMLELYEQSKQAGFRSASVTGETDWLHQPIPGKDRFIEYEARINQLSSTHPCTLFCQYNVHEFSGDFLFDIIQVHPLMVVQGRIIKNPAYKGLDELLAQYENQRK